SRPDTPPVRFAAIFLFAGWLGCAAGSLPAAAAPRDSCPVGDPSKALPVPHETVIPPKKKAWEAALGGEEAARPHVQARLVGWPQRLVVEAKELPPGDGEFAARLARDTWRGLDALSDRQNGLPINNVRFDTPPARDASGRLTGRVGDYAGPTDIGLRLIAIV